MIHSLQSNHPRRSSKYCLVTGVTGLLGRYLLRDLLLAGHRIAVLARSSKRHDAADRIEAIMQHWEREAQACLPRPVVLVGDVREPNLGMSSADQKWFRAHCDRVVHGAAVLQFFGDRQSEPWTTNVDGTRNVVELCRRAGIEELHYLSTAYVCGNRKGRILEDELDADQTFRNDYEQSKFIAESMVRDHFSQASLTVYRPAVIIGDSTTGATSSYHGLFLYLRLLAMLVPEQGLGRDGLRYTPIRLPFRGDEPRNLVPVDWVSRVICEIVGNGSTHGRTFHLAPDVGTTARSVIDYCCEYFGSYGVAFCDDPPDESTRRSSFAEQFFENTRIYQIYEKSDPLFDRTNLLQATAGFPCPVVDRPMIHRFLKFGQLDQWGKAKRPGVRRHRDLRPRLRRMYNAIGNGHTDRSPIGFDVLGIGGGQWTLSRKDGRVYCARIAGQWRPDFDDRLISIGSNRNSDCY